MTTSGYCMWTRLERTNVYWILLVAIWLEKVFGGLAVTVSVEHDAPDRRSLLRSQAESMGTWFSGSPFSICFYGVDDTDSWHCMCSLTFILVLSCSTIVSLTTNQAGRHVTSVTEDRRAIHVPRKREELLLDSNRHHPQLPHRLHKRIYIYITMKKTLI